MAGGWPAFASSFSEDDPLLLLPSDDADDDPSSYLLYPPGFGPVEAWLTDPMPPKDALERLLQLQEEEEQVAVEESSAAEVMGLTEALSGKISLVGGAEMPAGSDPGRTEAVPEYVVTARLGISDAPREEICGEGEAPVIASDAKVDGDCKGEGISQGGVFSDADEGDDEDEDDPASSSSSSSSSSSEEEEEEEDDDDDDEDDGDDDEEEEKDVGGENKKKKKKKKKKSEGVVDLEDGEIGDVEFEEALMSSDEEQAGPKGPIKSKNEIEDLPAVPPVIATLEPHHQTFAVGIVSSIVGCRVIVEGVEQHSPLNEGSILWVSSTRSPLGFVDEIFGPVKNPYYIVRFNSATEIPAGLTTGTAISFATEFAGHVLNLPSLYKKGYDASGEHDEELDEDAEFSDDEKEAEYRRSLRPAKARQRNSEPPHFIQKKPFDRTRVAVHATEDRRPPQPRPQPLPQFQAHIPAAPQPQPFALRPQQQPLLQAQAPVAMPPTQFPMGQFQMPPMAAGMAPFGGQSFFPNPFWPHGIVGFPGMLPNPQMQSQGLAGFPGNPAFPAFQFQFGAPNPAMLPQAVSPWTGNEGPRQAAPPPGPASIEEGQGRMVNGGNARPYGRGRRPFGGRGGFRGRGRG
ncbi:uncharacterized protein LOC144704242 [Wolffia australiana]